MTLPSAPPPLPPSPWLTTEEACAYLRYEGPHRLKSLYRFLRAKGVAKRYRSLRRLLIARADLDEALAGRTAVRRRRAMGRG